MAPCRGQEEEAPTPRPVMPPAAMRKKKKQVVEQPLISLEDRLAGENIIAKRIEEEEKIRLQRLKEKTSGGQYHVYLIIYAICIVLAFLAQRVENEDMRNATHTSGRSVAMQSTGLCCRKHSPISQPGCATTKMKLQKISPSAVHRLSPAT